MDCVNYVSKPERRKPAPKLYIRGKAGCNLGMNSPCDQRQFHNYSIQRTPGLSESRHQENQPRTNYRYQKGSITKAHSNLAFKLAWKILLFQLIWMESQRLWLPPQHGAEMFSGCVCEWGGPQSKSGYKERWEFMAIVPGIYSEQNTQVSQRDRNWKGPTGFSGEFWRKNPHREEAKILSNQLPRHGECLTQLWQGIPESGRWAAGVWLKAVLQNPGHMCSFI